MWKRAKKSLKYVFVLIIVSCLTPWNATQNVLSCFPAADITWKVHNHRHFTWCLHSTVLILARLVTAWFMQRDGKQRVLAGQKNIRHGGVRSIVTAHAVRTTEKSYFELLVQTRTHPQLGSSNAPPRGALFVKQQRCVNTTDSTWLECQKGVGVGWGWGGEWRT
jgi:hypothetical protein